jgi:hypothetical protein
MNTNNQEKNFIYSLSDPRTGEIRYIGKTNNIKKRLKRHLSNDSLNDNTYRSNWIISLLRDEIVPEIKVVGEFPKEDINEKEIYYIDLYKKEGYNLTNHSIGGDGYNWTGRKHKLESNIKNKINNAHRKSVGQYDLEMNLINTYHSIREAEKETGINRRGISGVCKGIKSYFTAGGYIWKFIEKINKTEILEPKKVNIVKYEKPRMDDRMKSFSVYTLDGNLIEIVKGLTKVSEKYNCHTSLIKQCCDKKGFYQTKNLTFRYEGDPFDYVPYKHYRNSRQYKLDMYKDDILVKHFNSLKEAARYTRIDRDTISKRLKDDLEGIHNEINGYIFKFTENPYEIITP